MCDNLFDRLMQEIFKQNHLMGHLAEENRQLRRQLADLREARGISVEICGRPFALIPQSTPAPAQVIADPVPTSSSTPDLLIAVPGVLAAQQLPASHETGAELAEIPTHPLLATPLSGSQPLEEEETSIRTFLEEMMRDEFVVASTATASPTATWSQQSTKEDERAALRRHLIGSFLLE